MSLATAVVICHGYYHTPEHYQDFVTALEGRNLDAHCPQLPTSDMTKLNLGDIHNPDFSRPLLLVDIRKAKIALQSLQGKRVLLVAHSAGGWTATQAAIPELQAKTRAAKGLAGGIIGILFYGGFIIPVGQSITEFFHPKDEEVVVSPWLNLHEHGLTTIADPEKYLFNDLDPEVAAKWKGKLTASPPALTKVTNDAYASLPCGYVVLDGDAVLPKAYQEGMIALQSQKTGDFKIYHSPAGHAAHLSWTEGLAETVEDFLKVV
ncbi:alpha/beta-hydrolase [Corynespora cassiicola Philippines]|uniref:Alpha/beta-hydrolase n=1 Tax=Corynespora cassiicola Philippines TaxID=1448308 RepID=A0A2T2NEB8_CORCC|nr:alpha/beta-hydrolase [Corynespora cassiicola Philippines]